MAQFKDLVVSGAARVIGTLYANSIIGDLQGRATNADTATYDTSGHEITSYIRGLDINGRVISFTKGDGSTDSITVPETQIAVGTDSLAGTTKLYASTGTNTDGTINQQKLTELFADKLGSSETAAAAVKDGSSQTISETYIKNLGVSGQTVTVTKGDGSTSTFQTQDTTYSTGSTSTSGLTKLYDSKGSNTDGTMTQNAINTELNSLDTNKLDKSSGVTNASQNGTTVTFTKGDGSTFSINTQDTTYNQATTATVGLVKIVGTTGTSEEDVMTQKAVTDALNSITDPSNAVVSFSVNGTTVTYTKIDGTTGTFNTQDTTYGQANATTLGLVNVATATGNSETAVMSQKATTDAIKTNVANAAMDNGSMVFTKADGSTFSVSIPSASPATDSTPGLVKLYNGAISSATTATDGAPTQNAVANVIEALRTDLETEIGNIFNMLVYDDIDNLPGVGDPKTFYLVAIADPEEGANNLYDEYVWVSDIDEDTGEDNGYYELFGSCAIDLSQYYTSSEVDTEIGNATNNLIETASVNATTVTFTKADGSTFSINTQDTTYSNFGVGSAGLVPGYTAEQTNYVLTTGGWVAKVASATNADSATYATNAGTATNADTATYATNAGTADYASVATSAGAATNADSATYATNAGTATKATNADTATYATNAGTADYGTNAGTAAYATNAGTATYATNADTATYANGARTAVEATSASSATYASSASADASGNTITGYLRNASVSGTAITFTKGDGSTFSFNTQDNNTTYANATFATTAANGTAGLMPPATTAQVNYVMTGSGWVAKAPNAVNADSATYATNAGTATRATSAASATYASSAASISSDFEFDCGLES